MFQAPIYKLDNGDILYPYKNNWLCEDDLIDCITEGKRNSCDYEDERFWKYLRHKLEA
jgi:hypothetical protein